MRETGKRPRDRRLDEQIRENWKQYAEDKESKKTVYVPF